MQMGISEPWWQPLIGVLSERSCIAVSGAPPLTIWDKINAASTVVVAAATVFVAVLAFVEIRRAGAESRSRALATQARVSALAYALRRQVASWLGRTTFDPSFLGYGLLDRQGWMRSVQAHFDTAEGRLTDLVERSADAAPKVRTAITLAFAEFYRAAHIINEHLRLPRPEAAYTDAKCSYDLLSACAAHLKEALTDDLKLAAEQHVDQTTLDPPIFAPGTTGL
jgi:hypothetical protein